MDNSDKSNLANTQNPQKLFEVIKTLCYTFLQTGSYQVLMEMKETNKEEVEKEVKNIYNHIYDALTDKAIDTVILVSALTAGTIKGVRTILATMALFS